MIDNIQNVILQQDNIEKLFKYNEKEWKMTIKPSSNSFIFSLNKMSSNIIYQNFFNFEYLHLFKLFNEKNSIKDIITFIINLIEENNFYIEENYDNLILILKLLDKDNISLFLSKKENNIEEMFKILYKGNNEIKELIKERKRNKKKIKELKEINKKQKLEEIKEEKKTTNEIKVYNKGELENNYILAVYDIKNDYLNKKVQILNYEEKQSIYDNKKEIEENCEIYLKNRKIQFNYTYQFDKIDKYEFKFVFKKSINNIRYLFSNYFNLISLDLPNLIVI